MHTNNWADNTCMGELNHYQPSQPPKVKDSDGKEATANRRPEMESFSAHFNLTTLALLAMLALLAAVLVMGVTQDLATHLAMGPVCQRVCLKRDVTNVPGTLLFRLNPKAPPERVFRKSTQHCSLSLP